MTPPIPEAAVEVALAAYATAINAPTVEWIGTDATEGVKAALTAARPHMEADPAPVEAVIEWVNRVIREPDNSHRRGWLEANLSPDRLRGVASRAATIAERNQR